jgi:hypothetical protein
MMFIEQTNQHKTKKGGTEMLKQFDLNLDEQEIAEKLKAALPFMNAIQKSYLLGAGEVILMQHKPDPDQPEGDTNEKKPA